VKNTFIVRENHCGPPVGVLAASPVFNGKIKKSGGERKYNAVNDGRNGFFKTRLPISKINASIARSYCTSRKLTVLSSLPW
jgi:hypothetical protein